MNSVQLSGNAGKSGDKRTMVTIVLAVAMVLGIGVFTFRTPEAQSEARMSDAERSLLEQGRAIERSNRADGVQQEAVGSDMMFDEKGQLIGAKVPADLVQNLSIADVSGQNGPNAEEPAEHDLAQVAAHIEAPFPVARREAPPSQQPPREAPSREDLTRSMLAYSISESATWAEKRPAGGPAAAGRGDGEAAGTPAGGSPEDRIIASMERMAAGAATTAAAAAVELGDEGAGAAGAAGKGDALYPAEKAAQMFEPGFVGDMRIGPGAGEIVRQGKFLDSVLVNQLRVDLVESPVVAMVNRDFLSLDGEAVLIPAGAKLMGTAGQVGNVQQARVYIKFDRIIFPDQRSAYFPRKQVATDGIGAVGVPGDVDRHLFMQFGAAVMLGMLDGLAAAAQGPAALTAPRPGNMMIGRTSDNFSKVLASVIGRYANVVPTVTVEPGAKMKIVFAEDVRLSAYRPARER